MRLGVDNLIVDKKHYSKLKGQKLALVGHPASVTSGLVHSLDALSEHADLDISVAFGPQHGMRGDKQDNMIESDDFNDPIHGIPVYSLYGKVRRPSDEMMQSFDALLFDLQDVGCRIYTFLTTMTYILEACAKHKKSMWILDRPNPIGRPIEGMLLEKGWESFVGCGPMPMRHGLTLAEAAKWYKDFANLDVELNIVPMTDYQPTEAPGYGWPEGELAWVNPSPNAASLNMARCYAGTVLLEGTNLSEGRGTTTPLEVIGAPNIDFSKVQKEMLKMAPDWLEGCQLRLCYFEPTFHKHQQKTCYGFQLHSDSPKYNHSTFKPYRLVSLTLKAIHNLYPDFEIWRDFVYEYEENKEAINVINGGPRLKDWIENKDASAQDLEKILSREESFWQESVKEYLIY
jgi:uncharacterized protein YbbC (DUF1343 family)